MRTGARLGRSSVRLGARPTDPPNEPGDSLTDWKTGRLSKNLMSEESGGCSAPEAIWDAEKEKVGRSLMLAHLIEN